MNPVNPFNISLRAALLVILCAAFLGISSKADALTLAWDEDPQQQVVGYRVHYGTISGVYSTTVDTGGNTTVQVTDLLPNTTYYFVVTAYSSAGLESAPSNEITFTTPFDPLADNDNDGLPDVWESVHGLDPANHSAAHGALGDLDSDGVNNLIEYAFDLNPGAPTATALPTPVLQRNSADGLNYLVISYPKRVDDPRLTYNVQTTTDLRNWATASVEEAAPPVGNPFGNTVTVTVRVLPAVNAGSDKKTFVRVAVAAPSGATP